MGEAEDILQPFRLTVDEQKSYMTVRDRFQSFLWKGLKTNIIYEQCSFNLGHQEEGESAASIISDVYALAEHSGNGDLRDELIWDRLVIGIHDSSVSERL